MILSTSRVAAVSAFLLSTTSTLAVPVDSRGYFDEPEPELFRRAGDCFKLDAQHAPRIPGWSKILAARDERWGPKGGLVTNPPEYLDRGAMACLKMTEITSRWDAPPVCNEEIMDVTGYATGVNVGINGGKEATRESRASWTVMKSSEYSAGVELTFTMGTEEQGQAAAKFYASTTIKDESTSSTETVDTSKEFINYNFENKAGEECRATLKVTTCSGKARATVPVVASGNAWFYYDKAMPDKTKPGSSKHYHWNMNMAKVLSEEERTRNIELVGSIKTTTRGDYKVECKPRDGGRATIQKPLAKKSTVGKKTGASGTKAEGAKGKSGKAGKNTQASKPKSGKTSGKKPASKKSSGKPAPKKGAAPKKAGKSSGKKPAPKKANKSA